MADEAFALSPISARAAEPREEDYDAISAAFMETSRGRWFLTEYAKRNRNADTRMVLDAVARIEQNIAAQKPAPPDNSVAEAKLAEVLRAVRAAVDAARSAGSEAMDGLIGEEKLSPLRNGARIIREIAWRWREIGADGRICDLLDAQVKSIEASCDELASLDARRAFDAAFDLMREKIEGLAGGDLSGSPVSHSTAEAHSSSHPTPVASHSGVSETAPTEMASAETAAHASADVAEDDFDEAILDAVALEMAFDDPVEPKRAPPAERSAPVNRLAKFDEINDVEIHLIDAPGEPPIVAPGSPSPKIVPQQPVAPPPAAHTSLTWPESAASMGEPAPASMPQAAVAAPSIEMARSFAAEISFEAPSDPAPAFKAPPEKFPEAAINAPSEISTNNSSEISPQISLGSSLIASGIVKRPAKATGSDPMAPIRRLSQAEKIALFS